MSEEAKSLISALLDKDPKIRIGNYFNNPENPKNKLGADEIIDHPFFNDIDFEKVFSR